MMIMTVMIMIMRCLHEWFIFPQWEKNIDDDDDDDDDDDYDDDEVFA